MALNDAIENRWHEDLPKLCPPADAEFPNAAYLRFIAGKTPTENDFVSQRFTYPTKQFIGVDECIARSLSVFDNLELMRNKQKLPKFRHSNICMVDLSPEDGMIKKTFGAGHHSWWRSKNFDISKAKVI